MPVVVASVVIIIVIFKAYEVLHLTYGKKKVLLSSIYDKPIARCIFIVYICPTLSSRPPANSFTFFFAAQRASFSGIPVPVPTIRPDSTNYNFR